MTKIVGHADCTFHEVAKALTEDERMGKHIGTLMVNLGLSDDNRRLINQALKIHTMNIAEATMDALETWSQQNSSDATLEKLVIACDNCRLKFFADKLRSKFMIPEINLNQVHLESKQFSEDVLPHEKQPLNQVMPGDELVVEIFSETNKGTRKAEITPRPSSKHILVIGWTLIKLFFVYSVWLCFIQSKKNNVVSTSTNNYPDLTENASDNPCASYVSQVNWNHTVTENLQTTEEITTESNFHKQTSVNHDFSDISQKYWNQTRIENVPNTEVISTDANFNKKTSEKTEIFNISLQKWIQTGTENLQTTESISTAPYFSEQASEKTEIFNISLQKWIQTGTKNLQSTESISTAPYFNEHTSAKPELSYIYQMYWNETSSENLHTAKQTYLSFSKYTSVKPEIVNINQESGSQTSTESFQSTKSYHKIDNEQILYINASSYFIFEQTLLNFNIGEYTQIHLNASAENETSWPRNTIISNSSLVTNVYIDGPFGFVALSELVMQTTNIEVLYLDNSSGGLCYEKESLDNPLSYSIYLPFLRNITFQNFTRCTFVYNVFASYTEIPAIRTLTIVGLVEMQNINEIHQILRLASGSLEHFYFSGKIHAKQSLLEVGKNSKMNHLKSIDMQVDNVNFNILSEQVFEGFCNYFPSVVSFKIHSYMLSVNEFGHLMCKQMQEIDAKVYHESSNTNVSNIFSSLKGLSNLHRLNLYIGFKNCTKVNVLPEEVSWSKGQIIKICSNCNILSRELKCMLHSK